MHLLWKYGMTSVVTDDEESNSGVVALTDHEIDE